MWPAASTPGARRSIPPCLCTEVPNESRLISAFHPVPLSLRSVLGYGLSEAERLKHREGRYAGLLVAVLLPVLLLPMTGAMRHNGFALVLLIELLILQSLYTLSRPISGQRGWMDRGGFMLLGLICLILLWVPVLRGSWQPQSLKGSVLGLLSLFFLVTSVRLVQMLARAPRVNARVMAGAAAGYLLLGVTGGVIGAATHSVLPQSFQNEDLLNHEVLLDKFTYFSFMVIAGLGSSDIVPTNAVGERFVILLSVSSTLYVALLVGLLLGRFIASQEAQYLEGEPNRFPESASQAENRQPPGTP